MSSNSGIFAKFGLAAAFLLAILLFAFLSEPEIKEPALQATVMGNIEQVAESPSPENQVRVQLPTGSVVNAWVPANAGFPFLVGAQLQVTPYRGRMSGKRTYWVEARRAKP